MQGSSGEGLRGDLAEKISGQMSDSHTMNASRVSTILGAGVSAAVRRNPHVRIGGGVSTMGCRCGSSQSARLNHTGGRFGRGDIPSNGKADLSSRGEAPIGIGTSEQ